MSDEILTDRALGERGPLTRKALQILRSKKTGPPYYIRPGTSGKARRVYYKYSEYIAWLTENRIEPKK